MTTKLTLSIKPDIIEKAKRTLQTKNQSLSGLVEDYFRLLIRTKQQPDDASPIVRELTGMAGNIKKSDKAIYDYLAEKYK